MKLSSHYLLKRGIPLILKKLDDSRRGIWLAPVLPMAGTSGPPRSDEPLKGAVPPPDVPLPDPVLPIAAAMAPLTIALLCAALR